MKQKLLIVIVRIQSEIVDHDCELTNGDDDLFEVLLDKKGNQVVEDMGKSPRMKICSSLVQIRSKE